MEIVREADQCVKVDMIAWVSYPANNNSFCFVYPRYLIDSGEWKAIDSAAFPNNGSFFLALKDGLYSQDAKNTYGSLVVARVNIDHFFRSNQYEPHSDDSSSYSIALRPSLHKGASELEFEVFSEHSMSADLVQIVDLKEGKSFDCPFYEPVFIDGNADDLMCRLVLVRSRSGKCYGPFNYQKKDEQSITLAAPRSNDYRIVQIDNLERESILIVRGNDNVKRCEFIEKRILDKMIQDARDEGVALDWMPQSEIVDIITRAINASDELRDLSKNQLRNIKTAIRHYSDDSNQLNIDDARKTRIINWISGMDSFADLPSQVINEAIDSIPDDRVLALVQDRQYFPLFKDRIIESSGIQEFIAEERRRLEASLTDVKSHLDQIQSEIDKAEHEAAESRSKAEEAREQLERVRDEALNQKREELEGLESDIKERKGELAKLESEYERAIVSKNKIERDVEEIISGINDEVSTSTKILESEILRKVVAAVSGVDLKEVDGDVTVGYDKLRANESSMSDDDIVNLLFDSITRRAGRQLSKNDVINLLICLTQGYITTFAGQPGTGKTSLCNILAGVLGLSNKGAGERFTEINVENGWTSYKDYVGYYNPLSKTYEKANTSVFDAMRMLTKEQNAADNIPPFIFLLDEANLSPIEHYWSPFLRACDTFKDEGASLSLGGRERWCLPSHVRFLATVNFDHTTEALSHRFLDRSWIITLESGFIDSDCNQINIAKEFELEDAFSSRRLFQAFEYKSTDIPNQDNAQLLDELIRTCRSHSLSISPRSQLMMRRYVSTASRLMSLQSRDSQYAPLDYAFSQKVLPQITGPSEIVAELIEDLIDRCSPLKTTKRQLERMKSYGEDSGFYQYFI